MNSIIPHIFFFADGLCHRDPILKLYVVYYTSITKTLPFNIMALFMAAKTKSFRWKKKCDLFVIFARNRDCGYLLEPPHRGGSNEYPQSMFYSRNKKNNVYPCKPYFFPYKSGVWKVKITWHVFVMIYFLYAARKDLNIKTAIKIIEPHQDKVWHQVKIAYGVFYGRKRTEQPAEWSLLSLLTYRVMWYWN